MAQQAGKPYTAQSLLWNDYPPKWLTAEPQAELQRLFESHLSEVLGRYRGKIDTWVVVNEPFAPWDDSDGMYRKGPWFKAFGADYIARAFRRARELDAGAKLMLNEGWCERADISGQKVRVKFLDLVKRMKDDGVPLDVVGLQGHLQPQFGSDDVGYVRFITDLAAQGVEVRITELDVDDSSFRGSQERRDQAVAKRYAEFLSKVLANPAVSSVCMWGLTDRYTWYSDVAKQQAAKTKSKLIPPRPLPFDRQLRSKPAYAAIAAAFRKNARTASKE
jgi:endo-1,4-beta-xylanase